MEELFLATKIFSKEDQVNFANFSGDYNPIHLDPIKSRKTVSGECIVHGINSFLCALEFLLINRNSLYSHYLINFKNKIPLNEKITFVLEKNNTLSLRNKNNKSLVLIKCTGMLGALSKKNSFNFNNYSSLNSPLDFDSNNFNIGVPIESRYGGEIKYANILFPFLSKKLGINSVYEISTISNIIGMQIPGRNSLFTSCEINLQNQINKIPTYTLESFKVKLKLLKLKYEGINLDAKMQAFLLKNSKSSLINKKLKEKLFDNTYHGRKALVIGGSRGIGSFVAKVLGLLGSKVTVTYSACYEDALAVCQDINQNTGKMQADLLRFDVLKDNFPDIEGENFDCLFYFPTPKIFDRDSDKFSEEMYIQFKKIYAIAFRKIAIEFAKTGGKKIYYPSSIAVEQNNKGMEEYKMAKRDGEFVCNDLNKKFNLEILVDRLDRVATDQTLSIIPIKSLDPYEVAVKIVNMMK